MRAGIDETSSRRGQDYVSVFADLDQRRAVYVCEGRDQGTVQAFSCFLETHGGEVARVKEVCQDMSQAYSAGVRDHLKKAKVTFDRFHVKQKLSEAIDTVRRQEAKTHKELLKNTRYLWLKRPDNLTVKQLDWLDVLLLQPLDTVRAYELALKFDDFYELTDAAEAEEYLRRWVTEARGSELEPLAAFADTLEAHWTGCCAGTVRECPTGYWKG